MQFAVVGVLIGLGIVGVGGMNADEVAVDARNQRTLGGDRPRFEVRLDEVGVFFEVPRRGLLASLAGEVGGANQRGDVRGQRRGGVTAGFFPAFLGSDRAMVDEIAGRGFRFWKTSTSRAC